LRLQSWIPVEGISTSESIEAEEMESIISVKMKGKKARMRTDKTK